MVSLALIGVTLAPVVKSPKWYVRIWEFPRLQIAIGLALAIASQIAFVQPNAAGGLLLAASLGCLALQTWRIYPYTPFHPVQAIAAEQSDPENTVRLLIANLLQDNRNADSFLRLIQREDPDLVLAVEADRWWDRQLAVLRRGYTQTVRHPLENTYGMLLFSRLPLTDILVQDRVTQGIPSIFARVRLRSGRQFDLYCIHPEPPKPATDVEERNAELLLVASDVSRAGRPAIVCGDLNDVAWSHTTRLFQRTGRLLDPRVGRGIYPTFHAGYPFARWPLDHVFHDASFRLGRLQILEAFGSDHFAVCIDLVHDPAAAAAQEPPAPERGDRSEAAGAIEEGSRAAADKNRSS
ncbi:MAG TPA: endonuclease/exonuclease/phosphatase family protein [Alphaproteobacteria bacterium]|nr:endonuclease/exonuclease/phosphatase family protein [Alphaproteobacteria bacterium]